MNPSSTHPLVKRYLRRLDDAARRLPRAERRELLDEIRAHLDAGLGPADSEAAVRNLLDDLGDPADIVAAAQPLPDRAGQGGGALVLGVVALVATVVAVVFPPLWLIVALPAGLVAVVLGVRARRSARAVGATDDRATAAAVIGGIAVAVPLVAALVLIPVRSTVSSDREPTGDPRAPILPRATID